MLPNTASRSPACNSNCLSAAIAPSVVSVKLSNEGASSVFANATRAILVSSAFKPA